MYPVSNVNIQHSWTKASSFLAFDVEKFIRDPRAFAVCFDENVISSLARSEEQLGKTSAMGNPMAQKLLRKFRGSYRRKNRERICGKTTREYKVERLVAAEPKGFI